MIAQFQIERSPHGYVDRYRSYEVIVNGEAHSELRRGEKKTIEVEPGEIEVFLKIDWCRSRVLRLMVDAGSEIRLFCRPRRLLTAFYGLTFGRHNYILIEITNK